MSTDRSRCTRCRTPLASDNHTDHCASCQPIIDQLRQHPPTVPPAFWTHPTIRDAAHRQHMGNLLAAYRRHPHHGAPIAQLTVGLWARMSQSQISKLETGPPPQHIPQLTHWARLLHIPPHLHWFTGPAAGNQAANGSAPVNAYGGPRSTSRHPFGPGATSPRQMLDDVDVEAATGGHARTSTERHLGRVDTLNAQTSGERTPTDGDVAQPGSNTLYRLFIHASATDDDHAPRGMVHEDGIGKTGGMLRRTLLLALAAYSASLPATYTKSLPVDESYAAVDSLIEEWRQACDEYGFEYHTQPRRELAQDLMDDLLDVRRLLAVVGRDSQVRGLSAVVARLAGLAALVCTDLGYRREVKHLWRLSRRMALVANEPGVLQWVYGHEATSGIYFGRPLDVVVAIADQGLAAHDAPTAGRAELLGGKAQALALAGAHQAAARLLITLEETFDQLPDRVTNCSTSVMGWPEQRLRHAESFVHSTAGALKQATRAQERALSLYLPSRTISRTQIELHRAECSIRVGNITDGALHARETLERAASQWRNRYVLATVAKVADAVPQNQNALPAVAGLRNDIAAALQPTDSN